MSLPINQIICGDNVAVMSGWPDACIDLTVTSPPYDDLRQYNSSKPMSELWDFEAVAQQLWRVTKPGGVVVWVVADATVNGSETGTSFRQALRFMEIGFRLHDTMIYKQAGTGAKGSNLAYWQEWDFMFVFSVGSPKAINRIERETRVAGRRKATSPQCDKLGSRTERGIRVTGETCVRGNVWEYHAGKNSDYREACFNGHPAPFPESLARDHILSWSNEGDVVLDCFAGSGTTCKMARAMGRRWVGIEINPDYVTICKKRMAQQVLPIMAAPEHVLTEISDDLILERG